MVAFSSKFVAFVLAATTAFAASLPTFPSEPNPSLATSITLNGNTFVNKGMVAFGLIPNDATDSSGDTIGGIGSANAIKRGTFAKNSDDTFSGTFIVQPDRGYNVEGTIDYQGRQHQIKFVMTPYYGTTALSFTQAQTTLSLTYENTLFYTERQGAATTGLDADGVRPAQNGFPGTPTADPVMPIPSSSLNRLTVDCEGLVLNSDGTFWMSDEYGPYIYRFDGTGALIQTIQPPNATLPLSSKGNFEFTSSDDPHTGRAANQGFEGLTVTPDGNTLYALLQTATIQDGGDKKSTSRYTRMFSWDISNPTKTRPALTGEWVVPLPQDSDGDTLGQSETHYVSDGLFLVLSRDGNGNSQDDTKSTYKQADLVDISSATDIHGTKFDLPANPIASKGKLVSGITPATYTSFVSFIDSTQLARFGLHNGNPDNTQLIDGKWESLALAPCMDSSFPDDYFLFTAADNDFLSHNGVFDGESFDAGVNVDNQFMVWRVTLPTVPSGSVEQSIGI